MIPWKKLETLAQLDEIDQHSQQQPVVILKHSTRCSISSMALARLERSAAPENAEMYLLDLLRHRDISNTIADRYNVQHESPQVLIIKNAECTYHESHGGIRMDDIGVEIE